MKFCTISPFSKLESLLYATDYDDDELADLITMLKSKIADPESESVVTCEEGATPDRVGQKMIMAAKQRQRIYKRKRRESMIKRYKRQAESSSTKADGLESKTMCNQTIVLKF